MLPFWNTQLTKWFQNCLILFTIHLCTLSIACGQAFVTTKDAITIKGAITIKDADWAEIRNGNEREWADFSQDVTDIEYVHRFDAISNPSPWTLTLRQQDVKETWTVSMNDRPLGQLVRDENDLLCDFEIPVGLLLESGNELAIRSKSSSSDDIRLGEVTILPVSPKELRSGASIEIVITDDQQRPLPGRITLVDRNGTLIPLTPVGSSGLKFETDRSTDEITRDKSTNGNDLRKTAVSDRADLDAVNDNGSVRDPLLAARHGVLYTATGHGVMGVQPGEYVIYAGRGFEYSLAKVDVEIKSGQHVKRTLTLSREVDTEHWIACDTHVHTVTYSGHGDCTLNERLVTLAGEGIELPIATDHNTQIDFTDASRQLGTARWFTPVVGNEVTTKRGHFNIFPTSADAPRPNHQASDWSQLFDSIFENPKVQVAILNHARDLHSGFRPFSPRHHVSLSGSNLDGFDRRFNAMELINSGAVQTNPKELFQDWCGLINHGMSVTPIGSSDSHDVSRYIVGQGRTYIAGDDTVPGSIDVEASAKALAQGKVIVSYGLFANLVAMNGASDQAGPGELLTLDRQQAEGLRLHGEVRCPSWSTASTVELWINGQPWTGDREESDGRHFVWTIPHDQLTEDCWFTIVATGPGIQSPHWPTAKPYQPDSIYFTPYVFSCSGPIRVDVDGDGVFSSANAYARRLLKQISSDASSSESIETVNEREAEGETARGESHLDLKRLAEVLEQTSPAVTAQLLALVRSQIVDFSAWSYTLSSTVRSKIQPFERAWQQSIRAGLEQKE